MNRPSRRCLAWALLAVGLLCIALAVVSKSVFVSVIAIVSQDAYLLGWADGDMVFGKSVSVMPDGTSWWECFQSNLPSGMSVGQLGDLQIDWMSHESSSSGVTTEWCYAVPLHVPILLIMVSGALLFYFSRLRPGTCKKCGYDLKGGFPKCPECGADTSARSMVF